MATENTELARRQPTNLTGPSKTLPTVTPVVDVYENDDEILVVADFPGVSKDSLTIELDGSEFLIEGSQGAIEAAAAIQPVTFSRSFRVSSAVDPDGVSAELSRGILRVHLAKSEAAKPRRIEVRGH